VLTVPEDSPHTTAAVRKQDVPLIAHVIFRLDIGGLENGLVNLINRIPVERFRHAVICLTDYSAFHRRIRREGVPVYSLHKPPGNSPLVHFKLWRLLAKLRPDIVHTRNLASIEGVLPAMLAGVPVRIHSEHGHDMADLAGGNRKYQRLRRALRPFIHHYIALSKDLERYLHEKIRVSPDRVTQLYNGVDTKLFHPTQGDRESLPREGFAGPEQFVIGTVGRMQAVKDPANLARAFVRLVHMLPDGARRLRLVMIGDGPLKAEVQKIVRDGQAEDLVWLAGERDDVARIMRGLDLFVLPSISEGISNTLLEAMASGLPVVATNVGGNPELVEADVTGALVPRADADSMARAMKLYVEAPELRRRHGAEARRAAELRFGMEPMVNAYMRVYDKMLERTKGSVQPEFRS
jgi:sugar transferase (PEP-CTERM/EpsH1 system associated)